MKSKGAEYVSKYNRHYYKIKTKIDRQLRRIIAKAKEEFSQRNEDLNNYQSSWVDFLIEYDWSSFGVFKEDLLTSNLNTKIVEVNKAIKEVNKDLPKEYRLPSQPLKARSLKSLQNYTEKYFKFLYFKKLVDRVIWTFEQDKKGLWHVHALFNLYKNDILIDRIKEYWLIGEDTYIEPVEDLRGSLIYISKSFSKYNLNKIKNIENYNMLGNFTHVENPLKQNNNIIEMKKIELTEAEKMQKIHDLKTKMNLHLVIDEKFIENQKRINAKYDAISTDLMAIKQQAM
ncbi:hypothetical protein [Sphingobacterium sp.]|uniref:hypothetical protein n=1 Tax=Sphingobacterium sp. TaxID=341027 RepID=UPI002FDB6C3A